MTTATAARPVQFIFPPASVGPVPAIERVPSSGVAAAEVCELIEAAGPLTVVDIAGGLGVSARCAAGRVRQMVSSGCLREDEFGRYRLWGACA